MDSQNLGQLLLIGVPGPELDAETAARFLQLQPGGFILFTRNIKAPEQLRKLDVVVLSDLILEKNLELGHEKCAEENLIDYFSDPDEALDKAVKETAENEGDTVIFLMNNTEVGQVKNVSDAELVMPHKSTYFYPKILTGLVMNRMIEGEKVDI